MNTDNEKTKYMRIRDISNPDINGVTNTNLFNTKTKKKRSQEEENRINHFYINENIILPQTDEPRYQKITIDVELESNQSEYLSEDQRKKMYNNEEDEILCGRYPHLSYCGCIYPCSIILNKISPIEIGNQILVGPIECVYKTKELLKLKVTHVLNVSCTSYNQRKYFKFMDIFVSDSHTENAIKFFKVTNRFIDDTLSKGENILIHSLNGKSRCWVFLMAYLIGRQRMKYTKAYEFVKERFKFAEPNENFLTQLKHYDLESNV